MKWGENDGQLCTVCCCICCKYIFFLRVGNVEQVTPQTSFKFDRFTCLAASGAHLLSNKYIFSFFQQNYNRDQENMSANLKLIRFYQLRRISISSWVLLVFVAFSSGFDSAMGLISSSSGLDDGDGGI